MEKEVKERIDNVPADDFLMAGAEAGGGGAPVRY
tara:strand:- start:111 stop:212 length:102 start_codon:yes stop_codon:yes gene_type:complete